MRRGMFILWWYFGLFSVAQGAELCRRVLPESLPRGFRIEYRQDSQLSIDHRLMYLVDGSGRSLAYILAKRNGLSDLYSNLPLDYLDLETVTFSPADFGKGYQKLLLARLMTEYPQVKHYMGTFIEHNHFSFLKSLIEQLQPGKKVRLDILEPGAEGILEQFFVDRLLHKYRSRPLPLRQDLIEKAVADTAFFRSFRRLEPNVRLERYILHKTGKSFSITVSLVIP